MNLINPRKKDPIIHVLNRVVFYCIYLLAILAVVVIVWSLLDLAYDLYEQTIHTPEIIFNQEKMMETLGNFLVVMIAIEIYLSIIFFLRQYSIHVPLVLAIALTAVSRKVIILEYTEVSALLSFALASVIFSVGIIYWLVSKKGSRSHLSV